MTAREIREMDWSNRATEHQNLYAVLREIAAQLAEIRGVLGSRGPEKAPDRKKAM